MPEKKLRHKIKGKIRKNLSYGMGICGISSIPGAIDYISGNGLDLWDFDIAFGAGLVNGIDFGYKDALDEYGIMPSLTALVISLSPDMQKFAENGNVVSFLAKASGKAIVYGAGLLTGGIIGYGAKKEKTEYKKLN